MSFTIRMGIPEMLELWTELSQKNATGTISKKELYLYKKWGKAMAWNHIQKTRKTEPMIRLFCPICPPWMSKTVFNITW